MFIVEDGTGLPDANSYVSVAEADAFHADRNNAAWTGADAVKQAALVKATDYVSQKYDTRWKDMPDTDEQGLYWPVTCIDGIPARLKQAVCLLALEALSAELNPTQGRAVKREKVDVIEIEYMDNALPGNNRPAIDGLLKVYLAGAGLNAKVLRV